MDHPASVLARDLAAEAERVCQRYLSNGRREGSYWRVGDKRNTPGRSLYVRLDPSGDGRRPGKWTDAQSGEHGDLLDIVRAATASGSVAEALCEARAFLNRPDPVPPVEGRRAPRRTGPDTAARRLFDLARPIRGTLAALYLQERGIPALPELGALRFHPHCWYLPSVDDRVDVSDAMPAMIAAVTDLAGHVTGVHRTWLTSDGRDKAMVASPRRAMGSLLGNGVRFGTSACVMAAGEGIETMLSIRTALPCLPAIAALSAAHLAALDFPPGLERLYVAREPDVAGHKAFASLSARAAVYGIQLLPLDSERNDFNADLRAVGADTLARRLRAQLIVEDRSL